MLTAAGTLHTGSVLRVATRRNVAVTIPTTMVGLGISGGLAGTSAETRTGGGGMTEIRPVVGTADVRRWDIYDVADQLASELEDRLWIASTIGGCVGPAPTYRKVW